jgi:predicted nucleic-acid-binding Zn-ribbon protein
MKLINTCSKCNSAEVVEVKGTRYNTNNFIYLNNWGTKYAILDRYICLRCGFTEEYVRLDEKFKKYADERREKDLDSDGFV